MNRTEKFELIKMIIPLIGSLWVIYRIIPKIDTTWWNISDKGIFVIIGLVFYQIICWLLFKVFCIIHISNYIFDFNKLFQ